MVNGMAIEHKAADQRLGQFKIILDQKVAHRGPTPNHAVVARCQASVSFA
jgi:hypothetical protein